MQNYCSHNLYQMKSQNNEAVSRPNVPILLIYYNFRGIGQMIRYLLTYLQLPFLDILLDEYQKQKLTLPPEVLAVLRSNSVNRNDLPAIVHNNSIIYDLNQIMNYICIVFDREDLLGLDIFQKARVCEIQEIFSLRLSNNIKFLSNFVAEVQRSTLSDEKLLYFIERRLAEFFSVSGYSKQLSDLLIASGERTFVLRSFTIIDFYYVEHCRFAVKLFGNIDEQLAEGGWGERARKFRLEKSAQGGEIQNVENLRAMKKYIAFISSQEFYQRNQQYFESFMFLPKSISGEQLEGMKRLNANYFLDLYYGKQ